MKKIILFTTMILMVFSIQAQNVNIPDATFKAYLVGNSAVNTNGDTEIQVSEAAAFSGFLNPSFLGISDLTGIEAFTALTELYCRENQLTSLDVSANTALIKLSCSDNQLTSLDVSANTALTHLLCNDNQLTSLDVSLNTALTRIECFDNQLTNLDVSANTALIYFLCMNNQLTSLDMQNGNNVNMNSSEVILYNNPNLTCISVDDPAYSTATWTNVDAGATFSTTCSTSACTVNIPDANFKSYLIGNAAINTDGNNEIECSEASAFSGTISVNSQGISDLTGIEAFTALTQLECISNQLTNLDVSANTALTWISCDENQLTSLDVSTNTALTKLNCVNNELTSLDVTANTNLTEITVDANDLTSLDVSMNTGLTVLSCSGNLLTSLDVSANTALGRLICSYNQLTSLNMQNGNNSNMPNNLVLLSNNPNLSCIQVDDPVYSTATWTNVDAGVTFSITCTTGIENLEETELSISPNPTNGYLHIDTDYSIVRYDLFNINGQQLLTGVSTDLDISTLPKGMYILKIQTEQGMAQRKIIKE